MFIAGAPWLAMAALALPRLASSQNAPASAEQILYSAYLDVREDSVDARLARAVAAARIEVRRHPRQADAQRWLAAALGSEAMRQSPLRAIQSAREGYTAAVAAVALDSANAGARAVLGRYIESAARLPAALRIMLRVLPGFGEFSGASLRRAEDEYLAAIRFAPNETAWRHDYGCFLARSSRLTEAGTQAELAERLATQRPIDQWYRHDVRSCMRHALTH